MNSGTIILENKSFRLTVGEDAIVTVPGSLAGLSLDGWQVNLPPGAGNRTVEMRNGRIQIVRKGLMLILR